MGFWDKCNQVTNFALFHASMCWKTVLDCQIVKLLCLPWWAVFHRCPPPVGPFSVQNALMELVLSGGKFLTFCSTQPLTVAPLGKEYKNQHCEENRWSLFGFLPPPHPPPFSVSLLQLWGSEFNNTDPAPAPRMQ